MKDATLSRNPSTVASDHLLLQKVKIELVALGIEKEMNEKEFVEVLEKYTHCHTEVLLASNAVPLEAIDCYVRGPVIELNRLGFKTGYSCDGHDRNRPAIGCNSMNISAGYFNEHTEMESLDIEANYQSYELYIHLLQNNKALVRLLAHVTRNLSVEK